MAKVANGHSTLESAMAMDTVANAWRSAWLLVRFELGSTSMHRFHNKLASGSARTAGWLPVALVPDPSANFF